MKILITGATGFIGKELGKELVRRGHELRVMSRDITRARLNLPFPADIVSGRDGLPAKAVKDVDAIINLAGEPLAAKRWTKNQKEKIRDSRIKITSDLMRLVREASIKTVISASAIGFYGDRGDEVLTEESGPGTGFLAEVCRAWEAELFEGVDKRANSQPRLVALRFGVVLGGGGGALQQMLPLFRRGFGGTVGSGHQFMSWIHIHDLVQMIVFALENENVEGILNGVGPEPVDNAEFTRAMAKVIGRPANLPVPSFALKLALGEMAEIILSSQKVLPIRPQQLGFKFQYPSLEAALREINDDLQPGQEEYVTEQFVPASDSEVAKLLRQDAGLKDVAPEMFEHSFLQKYTEWRHTHSLLPMANGTLVRDRVIYRMPAGWVGQVSVGSLVAKDVVKIFESRRQLIDSKYSVR